MAGKQQNTPLDEWGNPIESGTDRAGHQAPPDLYAFGTDSDAWDDPQPAQAPGRKREMSKAMITAIAGGLFAIVLAVVLILNAGQPGGPADSMEGRLSASAAVTAAPAAVTTPPAEGTTPPQAVTTPPPTEAPATPAPTPEPTPTPTPAPVSAFIENEWYGPEMRYYYQQLDAHEQEAFEELYNGIYNCEGNISFPACTHEEFDRVIRAIDMDCPEFFHYLGSGTMSGYDGTYSSYEPSYRIDAATYRTLCTQLHRVVDQIKAAFPAAADDYEKEKVVHYWLADHCEYLLAGDDSTAFADACLYYGRSQCSGYCAANILVLRSVGIECIEVHSGTHAWNIVKINSRWYQSDITWDDQEIPWPSGGNRYSAWFNVPDRLVTDPDHLIQAEEGFTVPACSSLLENYAYREGIYVQAGKNDVAEYIADSLKNAQAAGKYSVSILVDDPSACADWDAIQDRIWHEQNLYGWAIYPPSDTQTAYAVYNQN